MISLVTSLVALAGCTGTSVSGRLSGREVELDQASFGVTEQAAGDGLVTARLRLVLRDSKRNITLTVDAIPMGTGKQSAVAGTGALREYAAVVDIDHAGLDELQAALARHQRPLTTPGTVTGTLRLSSLLGDADAEGPFEAQHDPALDQLLP
ncbi:MAG: hypothetical protein IT370_03095 [Deltaproteobacteria bacterium]|nr:hypothetical protein [Deltaproteobacteria bacterium]